MQAGQKLTKTDAHQFLADWMNKKLKDPTRIWNRDSGKSRWEAYMVKYKKAFDLVNSQTGFGLTAKDQKEGITTIAQKLDQMCPYYHRLNELFGQRENIRPFVIAEAGTSSRPEDPVTALESQIFDFGPMESHPAANPASQVFHFNNWLRTKNTSPMMNWIVGDKTTKKTPPEVLAHGHVQALQGQSWNASQPSSPTGQQLVQTDVGDNDESGSAAEISPVGNNANVQSREITPSIRKRQAKTVTPAQPKFPKSNAGSSDRSKPGKKVDIVSSFAESLAESNKLEADKANKELEYKERILKLEEDKLEHSKTECKAKMVADLLKGQVPWADIEKAVDYVFPKK